MSAKDEEIAVEVLAERDRQDRKRGEQNHPDGTGGRVLSYLRYHLPRMDANLRQVTAPELAQAAKQATDAAAETGEVTFTDILLEELFEALAETDAIKLRTELIQVAAVAQQWVSAIDRREATNVER